MQLTDDQRRILENTADPFLARCMRWLVDWGDAMGASRLVPVANTHGLITVPGNLVWGAGRKTIESAMELLGPACRAGGGPEADHGHGPGCGLSHDLHLCPVSCR